MTIISFQEKELFKKYPHFEQLVKLLKSQCLTEHLVSYQLFNDSISHVINNEFVTSIL